MRNEKNEKYVKWGVTAGAVVFFGLACFFLLSNTKGIMNMLHMLGKILAPFTYGAIIAYLLLPLCRKLQRLFEKRFKRKGGSLARGLAIVLSLLAALIVVLAVVLLIVPQLVQSIRRLIIALPGQIESVRVAIEAMLKSHPEWGEWLQRIAGNWYERIEVFLHSGLPALSQSLLEGLLDSTAGVSSVAQSVLTGTAGVAGVLSNLMLGMIVAVYLLARRKQLCAQGKLLLRGALKPAWADWVENELRFADRMFNGFFMGKLLDSAIVGVICFIGCALLRFESPLLIAVVIGVTNIIPFFGPYIGAIPCALLLLLENPVHCLTFLIFDILLQQLDGNFLGPRILGNSTGLSGLWVMFSILLFGGLWGIGGMIVGVPLMAVIYDVTRQLAFFGVCRHGQETLIESYNREFHAPQPAKPKKTRGRK